jgi:AraC-like DNA-binding protein
MPELDGFGVLEAMQKERPLSSIPVIVLTGQSLTSEEMQRLSRGVAAVLSKGVYSLAETTGFIAEALARSPRLGSEGQRLARRAMAYLHEHYSEPVARVELAAFLGVSQDHLTRCFHEEAGLTPTGYLRRLRIQRAKEMLAGGEKSVTEVALAVGFSDSNYFTRLFRQETGESPSAYRRS